jgi:hypothetical protein
MRCEDDIECPFAVIEAEKRLLESVGPGHGQITDTALGFRRFSDYRDKGENTMNFCQNFAPDAARSLPSGRGM